MKREIKFRAWDKQRHHMLDVEELAYNLRGELVSIYGFGRDFSNDPDALLGEEPDLDRAVLMEYTGLHDKNGREIYEGDVLDIGLRNQDGKPIIAPVSYETYAAGYVLDNGGNGIWQRLTKECEVIGNIFENPELLEAEK
ncbi:YopX family protein [Lacticaseibacillus paracasei]|uniref:YopX family protein n=1 Tax=Lacticaseibacillus paracasei TaxID=1597 RepID=UPI0033937D1B